MTDPNELPPSIDRSTVPILGQIHRNDEGTTPSSSDEAHRRLVTIVGDIGRQMQAQGGRGPWSTGERIAGALLADEIMWLPAGDTVAASIDRLGPAWLTALVAADLRRQSSASGAPGPMPGAPGRRHG